MSDEIADKVRARVDKQKTAIGMVFVGIVAAAALFKQKQARKTSVSRPES
jgi:hypothetical protein